MSAATPIGTPRSGSRSLWSIQYLRAVAALMVLFHHLIQAGVSVLPPLKDMAIGAYGINIFFVISGFIMYTAARNESFIRFWERRLTRIVPLYWLATFLYAMVKLHYRGFVGSGTILLTSILFIPHWSEDNTAQIWPFLVPGWTLNYEMFFYVLFSIGILSRHVVTTTIALIAALVTVGLLLSSHNAIFLVYTNPLLLEFLAGLLLGRLHDRLRFDAVRPLLWLGFGGLVAADFPMFQTGWLVGLSACAIIAGALAYEDRGAVRRWPFGKLLGDASYAIYLVHPSVLWILEDNFQHAPLSPGASFAVYFIVGLLVSVSAGLLVHRFVERPLLAAISRLLHFRRPPGQVLS